MQLRIFSSKAEAKNAIWRLSPPILKAIWRYAHDSQAGSGARFKFSFYSISAKIMLSFLAGNMLIGSKAGMRYEDLLTVRNRDFSGPRAKPSYLFVDFFSRMVPAQKAELWAGILNGVDVATYSLSVWLCQKLLYEKYGIAPDPLVTFFSPSIGVLVYFAGTMMGGLQVGLEDANSRIGVSLYAIFGNLLSIAESILFYLVFRGAKKLAPDGRLRDFLLDTG